MTLSASPMLRRALRVVLALLGGAMLAQAEPLGEILATGADSASAGRTAQAEVEGLAEDTRALAEEHATLDRQLDGIAVYNARLERQIAEQQHRLAEIDRASLDATALAREIVPLLTRMIDSLESFIALDKPFRLAERRARIAALRAGLERSDVSLAQGFRAVLEAYREELDYGRALGASAAAVEVDGVTLEVTLLQLGRLALFAQSADGATTLWWDPQARQWTRLEDEDFERAVGAGLRMARGETPPALLRLPVPAPEVVE